MNLKEYLWAYIILAMSVLVLGISDGVLTAKSVSIDLWIISIDDLGSDKPYVFVAAAIAAIIVSCVANLADAPNYIASRYMHAYKNNSSLVKYVMQKVAERTGMTTHGAPMASFRPTLRNRPIDLGVLGHLDGRWLPAYILPLPGDIHSEARLAGIRSFCTTYFLLRYVSATLIGVLAVMSVMI